MPDDETDGVARLEQDVADARRQIRELEEELMSVTYSISHDLRAPLRAIDGFSSILLRKHGDEVGEKAQMYLARIRANATELEAYISAVLYYSRLGRAALTREAVALPDVVADVVEQCRKKYAGHAAVVTVGDMPVWFADRALTREVLERLMDNAFKSTACSPAPTIEIGMKGFAGSPHLTITDNGVGFDARNQAKLFELFQVLHDRKEFPGVGAGLAIARRIVRRHGGEIRGESDGSGAQFAFHLGKECDTIPTVGR